jgi:hypothetical protein
VSMYFCCSKVEEIIQNRKIESNLLSQNPRYSKTERLGFLDKGLVLKTQITVDDDND